MLHRGPRREQVVSFAKWKSMQWDRAALWLSKDARDDFFPDVVKYADVQMYPEQFVARHAHRLPTFEICLPERYDVPKIGLLHREAEYLPLTYRLAYLVVLAELFPHVAPALHPACYSYRHYDGVSVEAGDYPFPSTATASAWNRFRNDFRRALGDGQKRWGVVTDIAAYYPHIDADSLVASIFDLVPADRRDELAHVRDFLVRLLTRTCLHGAGPPQNFDASSFFCSAFLTPVDREMARIRGVKVFRWVDDIRLVADTRSAALDALAELQRACRIKGLFLNPAKTRLLEPDSRDWASELDVRREILLRRVEDAIEARHEASLREILGPAKRALEEAEGANDDRMVRAFGGRILDIAAFEQVRGDCLPFLRELALRQLKSTPSRADWWCRFLSPDVNVDVEQQLVQFLADKEYSIHAWTTMWVVRTLIRSTRPLRSETIEVLRQMARSSLPAPVRAWAVVAVGRFGDDTERKILAADFLRIEVSIALRRAAVVAIQELRPEERDAIYASATARDEYLTELVEYVRQLEEPRYDEYVFTSRQCQPDPEPLPVGIESGFGLSDGRQVRFRPTRVHRWSPSSD